MDNLDLRGDPAVYLDAVHGALAMARALAHETALLQKAIEADAEETDHEYSEDLPLRGNVIEFEGILAKLSSVLIQAEWATNKIFDFTNYEKEKNLAGNAMRQTRFFCLESHKILSRHIFVETDI